jgi:hypothetical protein
MTGTSVLYCICMKILGYVSKIIGNQAWQGQLLSFIVSVWKFEVMFPKELVTGHDTDNFCPLLYLYENFRLCFQKNWYPGISPLVDFKSPVSARIIGKLLSYL